MTNSTKKIEEKTTDNSIAGLAVAPVSEEENMQNELEQQVQEKQKKILQLMAEIDNAQKRHQRDLERIKYTAIRDFALDMCTVLDNLNLALQSVDAQSDNTNNNILWQNVLKGLLLVRQNAQHILQKHQIQPINSDGSIFDPYFHEALQRISHPTCPADHVQQTLRVGYMIGNQVLRPAQVIVSTGKGQ